MKKLFTLAVLLAMALGANAATWNKVKEINFSDYTGFPHYVMGYVPEWVNGVMTDYGADYRYATQEDLDGEGDGRLKDGESVVGSTTTNSGAVYQKVTGAGPYWHQYFAVTGIPTQMDGHYKVVAKVKATEAASVNGQFRWSWSADPLNVTATVPASDEFVEVEWEYDGVGGTACDFIAQPGTSTATIEWESIAVYEDAGGTTPVIWQQWLTNDGQPIIDGQEHTNKWVGDAEFGQWPDWALETTEGVNVNWRGDNAQKICAWSLTMGKNNDSGMFKDSQLDGRARPYPTDIELESGTNNHVFAVHVTQIDCIDDCDAAENPGASTAWSNQFWIQAPANVKEGLTVRIKFRYKAEHACAVGTQWHRQHPSDYRDWNACGDVNFTEAWQDFEQTKTIGVDDVWSLAFNLCSDATNGRTPNVFYFDDLSWETMKLEEGYFIAGINTDKTSKYENLNDAIEFEDVKGILEATVGKKGDDETYVNQVMISTVKGDNTAFMNSTLKPTESITNDPEHWVSYELSSLAKLDLPGLGVWKVYLDTDYTSMAFEMLEGTEYEPAEPVAVYTYADELVLHAVERDYKAEGEEAAGTGQPWDSQFWIAADRDLKTDEVTVLKFQYKGSIAAHTTTQVHKVGDDGKPCTYLNWQAIGDVDFTEEWQDFETEFKVPSGDNGMRSIVFNMAEIKAACDYSIKNVQWYLKDASLDEGLTYENLISGASNFYFKESAETAPYTGIENVTVKNVKTSNAIYNIAGQRVNKDYKGLVIKDGKKFVK